MTLDRYNIIAPRPPPGLLSKAAGHSARRRRERRATPRVQVELCCEDLSGEAPFFRTTFDLSTFGVSTRCGEGHPIGTELWLRLHLPDGVRHPLDVRAVVVGAHEESGGMRLAFRSPLGEAVRRIHKYLFGKAGRTVAQA